MQGQIYSNLMILQKYRNFPFEVYEWIHVIDRYMSEIAALISDTIGYLAYWTYENYGECGHGGLPGSLCSDHNLRQPGGGSIGQGQLPGLLHQFILLNGRIVLPGLRPALLQGNLGKEC